MDRDDFIRAKFKTRGAHNIKTEITQYFTKSFSKKSKKTAVSNNPDLTFLVNFRTDICEQRTKSLILSGRYTKSKRGLPQKQKPCSDCNGKGCIFCNGRGISGFASVEGVLAQFFYKHYDCTQVKFTWIGGEDKNSLVNGSGRLFFAKLVNPKMRNPIIKKPVMLCDDSISLLDLCIVDQIPITPIKFQSNVSLRIQTNSQMSSLPSSLSKLRQFTKNPVTISDGSKTIWRTIHFISYKKIDSNTLTMNITADGGISIKKLVQGDGIEPNVSALLDVDCTCISFDFENITINDNN